MLMVKHEFNNFLDSLKTEGKLLTVTYLYQQVKSRPGLDLYYLRPKIEDLYKEGLSINPGAYLDLLHQETFFNDLSEWSANSLHNILEKCLELNREDDLIRVLKKSHEKVSTIKFVDLLKKVMILDNTELAEKILHVLIANKNHTKSKLKF